MSAAEPEPGSVIADRYTIDSVLGRGGMGVVYRATHRVTGRTVAVKWLLEGREERRERFLREARSMGRLSHPNVVGVLDAGDHDGGVFLAMDFLEGKSLREYVDGRALEPDEAIQRLMPALAGVAAAHQAGILHRDLKPENLFVCCDRDGTPFDTKVLDFGVAKVVGHADEPGAVSLTHSGTIVGTPRYMAPEQLEERSELDARCDVYALGVILYELLTGQIPYRARSLNALMLEILTGDVRSPAVLQPELPDGLCEVVLKALSRETGERFESVEAFARALEPWGGGARFEAPRVVHTPGAGKPRPQAPESRPEPSVARSTTGEEPRPSGEPVRPSVPTKVAKRSHAAATAEPTPEAALAETLAAPSQPSITAPTPIPRRSPLALGVPALIVLLLVGGGLWWTQREPAVERASEPAPPTIVESPPSPVATPEPEPVPAIAAPTPEPEPELVRGEDPPPPEPTPEPRMEPTNARAPRQAQATRERSPEPTPTAEPPPPTADRELRVEGRAGVLRSDEF
jgi:serine/threonine-protein kinase